MATLPQQLSVETRIYGSINGERFELAGHGDGLPYKGVLSSRLQSTMGPVSFPLPLLPQLSSLGYQTFCKIEATCRDLFKVSSGYEYERHFTFEDGKTLRSKHKITSHHGKLVGDFFVQGDAPSLDLIDVEPLVEIWVPAGPGKIRGNMLMAWKVRSGSVTTAMVDSEYRLNHQMDLQFVHFRHAKFKISFTDEMLEVCERQVVFRDTARIQDVVWDRKVDLVSV
jgi:hypothetical protein